MSDGFDPDEWVESNTGYTYEHIETGEKIHSEAYEGRKHRSNIIESADVTQNHELRALVEQHRCRAEDNERKADHYDYESPLHNLYAGIMIGRERAANDLESVIDDE